MDLTQPSKAPFAGIDDTGRGRSVYQSAGNPVGTARLLVGERPGTRAAQLFYRTLSRVTTTNETKVLDYREEP